MQRLLSARKAAIVMGINRNTVNAWAKTGKLPIAGYDGDRPLFDAEVIGKIAEELKRHRAALAELMAGSSQSSQQPELASVA